MKGEEKKRLTAQRKLELYFETRQKDANLGEILRRHGVFRGFLLRHTEKCPTFGNYLAIMSYLGIIEHCLYSRDWAAGISSTNTNPRGETSRKRT